MSKLNNLFIFTFGAAIGSVATWKVLKDKYEKIAQEEIDSVKEKFSQKAGIVSTSNELLTGDDSVTPDEKIAGNSEINEYNNIVVKEKYTTKGDEEMYKPYVISPEEFGEKDYDQISLTYYADEVLTDEENELLENIDATVGLDSLNHFGEYEDDSVFVRNDRLKTDFEILLDHRNYSEVSNELPPHIMEE